MEKSHLQSFLKFVNRHSTLKKEDSTKLSKLFELLKFENKTNIFDRTNEESSIFFVCSGLVRYYYLTEDGKEWNKAFIRENMMSTNFSKDFLGRVSPYGIETMEKTELLIADLRKFESLYEEYPMIERLGRKVMEMILIGKMKRERSFLENNATMRYRDFIEQNPELFRRIPQYHLASYLGITEASLSRIISESR